jgi:hypothetical protein
VAESAGLRALVRITIDHNSGCGTPNRRFDFGLILAVDVQRFPLIP